MSNQRLVLIETTYGQGILFDQKDTVQAYQILSRATVVSVDGRNVFPDDKIIEIKLIAPSSLPTAADIKKRHQEIEPEPPASPEVPHAGPSAPEEF